MTVYNVRRSVVDLVEAESPERAIAILDQALTGNGFDVYHGEEAPADAFETEPLAPDVPVRSDPNECPTCRGRVLHRSEHLKGGVSPGWKCP